MSERPKWHHRIPETTARWFYTDRVVRIEHKWEMTGVDTSRDWLVLTRGDGVSAEFPTGILEIYGYELRYRPDHAGLVDMQFDIGKTLDEIDRWEKSNRRERSEYERLKKKFGA